MRRITVVVPMLLACFNTAPSTILSESMHKMKLPYRMRIYPP